MALPMRTAVIYSTRRGHTRELCKYISQQLDADIFDLNLQTRINLDQFDRVIVASGVYFGSASGKVSDYLRANKDLLLTKKTTLIVSCFRKGNKAVKQAAVFADEYGIRDVTFVSIRGEENQDGVKKELAAFLERVGAE